MAIKMFIVSKGFVQFHLNVLQSLNVVCMCGCVCVVAFSWQFEHSERMLHLNILVLSVRHLIFVTCYNSFTANFIAAFLVFELQTNGLSIVFPSLIGFVIFVPDKV